MKLFLNLILIALTVLNLYSCRRLNELPAYTSFPDITRQDPLQTPTKRPTFTAEINDQKHTVRPLYEYHIAGMVVSCGYSESLAEYRKDELNIMDAGLIWGSNLDPTIYKKIKFHTNGVWLMAKTKDRAVWEKLDQQKLSNNHLICSDPQLIKQIKALRRGTVISIKGCLASYSGRNSSVSRTDTGDHACEVIWVDQFNVLLDGTKTSYRIHRASLAGIVGILLIRFFRFLFIQPQR